MDLNCDENVDNLLSYDNAENRERGMTEEQEELIFGKLPKNRISRSKKNTPEKSRNVNLLRSKLGAEPI